MGYTEEFKKEAVDLYRSSNSGVEATAKKIGVSEQTLRNWIHKYENLHEPLDINERERLRKAEKEINRLREENEILKKAAAFFASETTKRR
jgi:transposase